MTSSLSTLPSPKQLGYANPSQAKSCRGQKPSAYFCCVYERCEHIVFLGNDVECKLGFQEYWKYFWRRK